LQAILDCAYASFHHYDENRYVWLTIRSHCKDLLGTEDYWRYRELFDKDVFDKDGDEHCLIKWEAILKKFDPDDKDVGSSDYEGQANLRDDFENNLKVMHIIS